MMTPGCVELHVCTECERQTDSLAGWVWARVGWLCPVCVRKLVA